MNRANLELTVGVFVLAGLACLTYMAVHLGKMEMFGHGYRVFATFENISGLKTGAAVEVAGVEVGKVEAIHVTPDDRARLILRLQPGVVLKEDAIASIRTKGIIGDKYVKLSPGSAEQTIPPGGRIRDTESSVEWEELVSKFLHGKV